jgi:CheY-like chemotaxis protein
MSKMGARYALIVDDDAAVREALYDLLTSLGWSADLAATGEQALACLEEDGYDVVLTDLVMPGMTGWDVLEAVRLRLPRMPILMITGSVLDATDPRLARPGIALVRKPVEARVLEQALGRVLDEMA